VYVGGVDGAFVTGGSGFIGGRLIERLVSEGVTVKALARSDRSAGKVRALGAEPVAGDLDDPAALTAGMRGAELVFHAAAHVEDWGDPRDFHRINVLGTRRVMRAARQAGARRVVHVGTEAALMEGQPLIGVDESEPLRPQSPALYSRTKALAEIEVMTAPPGIEGVSIRPRFVWGRGDTTLLPAMAEMVRQGKFAWAGGGTHLTETTHVDNTVEGLMLGAVKGRDRNAYFVTDGSPTTFRDIVTRLLETQGLDPGDKSIPAPVARGAAIVAETLWRTLRLPGSPPLTRFASWVITRECTISIDKARRELGYEPVKTVDQGLEELRRS
jgi:nucleoside-diphosphate-sugar epimerase